MSRGEPETTPRPADEPAGASATAAPARGGQLRGLLQAAHLRQAVALAVAMGAAALLAADGPGAAAELALGVLLVQVALGLGNDVADRRVDDGLPGKPVAAGVVPVGNATFVVAILVLVAIPVSLLDGRTAGLLLLATLLVGYVHNKWLHRRPWSFVGWMVTFALLGAVAAYADQAHRGGPPTVEMLVSLAALGLGVHVLTSLPDLVGDHASDSRALPLLVALRTGAPRLLAISAGFTVLAAAAVVASAVTVGLRA